MKPHFLICFTILSLTGISAKSAIAIPLQSTSQPTFTNRSVQVASAPTIAQLMRTNPSFEVELLKLTNIERQKVGLSPLKLSSRLGRSAQNHAADMARNNYFSHTGRNGSNISDRAMATGYKYSFLGENIAAGKATPEGTIRQWMNSPGHRANILKREFTEIGFGYANSPSSRYQNYWVQVFGTPQR